MIAVYGASLLLGSFLLEGTRVLSHHEVLFAQPAKEMLATGNWIVPTIAGQPSMHKPPGTHWLIALTMAVTGSDGERVVRLASVAGGVVAALLIAALAARWYGNRTGLVAGLMQLTTYSGLRSARLAEAEILLTAAVCGAMCCFALANVDGPRGRMSRRWLPWLFYLAATASFFFKGLVGPVFIFGGCGLFVLLGRDWRAAKFLLNPIGILVFAACVSSWSWAAYVQHPPYLDEQIYHHFGRMQGEMGSRRDPFYYLYSIPFVMLPWTPFLVLAAFRAIRRREPAGPPSRGLLSRFAACWILPGLIVLCLSAFKREHYLTPLMPPLAIFAAVATLDFIYRSGRRTALYFWTAAATFVLGSTAGVIAVELSQPRGSHQIALMIAGLGAALVTVLCLECYRGPKAHLVGMFAMVWLLAVGTLSAVLPHYDSYRDQTELARRVNRTVPAADPIYLVGAIENQIVYYLRPPVMRVDDPRELAGRLLPDRGDIYLVAPESVGDRLARLGPVEALDRCATVRWYLGEQGRLTLLRLKWEGNDEL